MTKLLFSAAYDCLIYRYLSSSLQKKELLLLPFINRATIAPTEFNAGTEITYLSTPEILPPLPIHGYDNSNEKTLPACLLIRVHILVTGYKTSVYCIDSFLDNNPSLFLFAIPISPPTGHSWEEFIYCLRAHSPHCCFASKKRS